MTPPKTTIAILVTLSVSLALADDFKTNNGKEYKNAIVTQVDLNQAENFPRWFFVSSGRATVAINSTGQRKEEP